MNEKEKKSLIQLLTSNDKFIGNQGNLLYRKSTDGRYGEESFVKNKYENKKDILCIIESDDGNVFGGYCSCGFKPVKEGDNIQIGDDKAYIFGIRSNKGYDPIISNIKEKEVDKAFWSGKGWYMFFGHAIIELDTHGMISVGDQPKYYEPLPTSYHFLGGKHVRKVRDVEIFQMLS